MPVEFTQTGYYEVWRDGVFIDRHNSERKCTQTITEHLAEHGNGNYEIRPPLIMAKGYGVLSPGGQVTDTIAPSVPGSVQASATSATTGTSSWAASTDNVGVAGYQVYRNGTPLGTTTELSYPHTGLTPSTQYSITVSAFDAAGNSSAAGGPAVFTTPANAAPVWSLSNQSYNTGTAVNIALDSFCTDADGDTITYSLVSGTLPTGLSLSGARNQTLSGTVTAAGTYNLTLGASDGIASRQDRAVTFTVTTPDTTPPGPPSAPTVASYGSSSITLNMPTSAASDHASYTVQRSTDGSTYGNRATGITASTWQDTGLSSSTTYHYRLIDVDTSGNASTAGSSVSQTTASIGSGSNTARINALIGAYSVPFTVAYPSDPQNVGTVVNVPSQMSLSAAVALSNRTINVAAGSHGTVTVSGTDLDIICATGATCTPTFSGTRIRWTGGDWTGRWFITGANDLLVDNVYSTFVTTGDSNEWQAGNANRIAFINFTGDYQSNTSGGGWAIHTNSNFVYSDIIIAGCYFFNRFPGQCFRMNGLRRAVLADTYIGAYDNTNSFRLHYSCNPIYIKNVIAIGQSAQWTPINNGDPIAILNGTIDGFTRYQTGNRPGWIANQSSSNTGTVSNTTLYAEVVNGGAELDVSPMTAGSGNQKLLWSNSPTVPSPAPYGADR